MESFGPLKEDNLDRQSISTKNLGLQVDYSYNIVMLTKVSSLRHIGHTARPEN